MDQAAKNHEEIKKLRKEVKTLNQSVEFIRQSVDGVHQTLSGGLQKLLSEMENLKLENYKIKSKLKYMVNSRSASAGESSIFSDSELRTSSTRWLQSNSSLNSRYNLTGNPSFPHSEGFGGSSHRSSISLDCSSDDTDEDRQTIVTDSIEEDTTPSRKKDKRKTSYNSPRTVKNNLTPDISSSDSDSIKQNFPKMSNHVTSSESDQRQKSSTASGRNNFSPFTNVLKQNSIETDQQRVPAANIGSNIQQQNGLPGTSKTSRSEVRVSHSNDTDSSDDSDLDTNIALECETKVSVTYPHVVQNYVPIMVDYDQIDFSSGAKYLKSLGFLISDPNVQEFIYKICALDNRKNEQLPKGLYTVLLLDTSYSTGPGGMLEMRKFVNEFLDEIETATEHNLEEMICVFEFGAHTGVLHEFTNDYSLIRECLDNIKQCTGRTILWSALLALFAYCHKRAKKCKINGKTHGVRVVMVSDGNVTDEISALSNSENEADLERIEERILKFMPYMLREKMTFSGVEIGMDSEPRFMKEFAKKGKGQYGLALWAKFVGRYYLYHMIIGKMLAELRDPKNKGKIKDVIYKHTAEFDYFGKTDIAEISKLLRDRYKIQVPEELLEREPLPEYDDDFRIDLYDPETYPRLPPIGSRMKPGQKFKDRHKRSYQNGTVVAHCRKNTMVVKWDELPTKIHFYKYETENHEVDVMHTYRQIDRTIPDFIDTGCRVIRGVHWDKGNDDGGRGNLGVVVRKHAKKWVTVKWPNGKRDRYRFGADGFYDLEVIDEEVRKSRNTKENTIQQYQFYDNNKKIWRNMDEEGNNSVINYIDSGRTDPFIVMHQGKGIRFDLKNMTYEYADDPSIKGELRLLGVTFEEQKELRKKEREIYIKQRQQAQQAQAGGVGPDFLSQLQQGGGRGGMNFLNQMKQGGGAGLAGMLGQGGMGGQAGGLAGLMGQGGFGGQNGLAGLLGQGGQGLMGQGGFGGQNGLAGLLGQGGQGLMGQGGNGGQTGFDQAPNSDGQKWNCQFCTYENGPMSLQCEMCHKEKA